MDKNLVNIDDLVRQRLSGGEEPERSGAWLQMRDLLDKEMPQRPGGMLYWRRALSAAALLLLVASVSVGSYKMYTASASGNKSAIGNETIASAANVSSVNAPVANGNKASDLKVAAINTDLKDKTTLTNHITTTNNSNTSKIANDRAVQNGKEGKHTVASSTLGANSPAVKSVMAMTGGAGKFVAATTSTKATDKQLATTAADKNGGVAQAGIATTATASNDNVAVNDITDKKAVAAVTTATTNNTSAKKLHKTGAKTTIVKATETTTAAAGNESLATTAVANDNNTTATTKTADKAVAVTKEKNTKVVTTATGSGEQASDDNAATASVATTADKAGKKAAKHNNGALGTDATASNTRNHTASKTKTHTVKTIAMNNIALASSTPSATTANSAATKATTKNGVHHKTTGGSLQPNSASKAGDAAIAAAGKAQKTNGNKGGLATTNGTGKAAGVKKSGKIAAAKTAKHGKGTVATTGKENNTAGEATNSIAAKDTKKVAVAIPAASDEDMKKISAINLRKSKKVMEKMEIYQHSIKNNREGAANERRYHLDTLSIETFTEDIIVNDEDNTTTTKNSHKKIVPGSHSKDAATDEADPNAAPPAAKDPAEKAKQNTKKKSGVSVIEKLQSTFNDIKYNVAAVQFAPGLTGGINGTFFGPNSFKGFQFGVTGTLVFNDTWSIMGELKYMHRINTGYTMNDDYNKYTYVASASAYEKDSFHHSYSFSVLHSFELPVTVRYSKGKCAFFAGGNFAYILGVNPSEDPQLATIKPTYVTTPGNNSTASFTPGDLQQTRFSIGYIFGFGYRIAPNFMLDFRNVQNIWDNANGSGSKVVSNQLYKSPSLQLSLTYNLGASKEKE